MSLVAMSDMDRLAALRRLTAGGIKPGWVAQLYHMWVPVNLNPPLLMLKTEVARRASSTGLEETRCANWSATRLLAWLGSHAPDSTDELEDKAKMERLAPAAAAAAAVERWKKHSMSPLFVNSICYLKSDFLERDATPIVGLLLVPKRSTGSGRSCVRYSMMTRTARYRCWTLRMRRAVSALHA